MRSIIKLSLITLLFSGFQSPKKIVPIWFEEYGVEIFEVRPIGDTIRYNKSSEEDFKFVFYSSKGKCYCERYLNGKLSEQGYFANSLDTLRRYVAGRSLKGERGPIRVQEYFQPLKNGEWIVYTDKVNKETYKLGVLIKR